MDGWDFFWRGEYVLFSGRDQIQEILGIGDGEERLAPSDDGTDVPQTPPDEDTPDDQQVSPSPPEAFIGTGGEKTFVMEDNQWYEVRTFRATGSLSEKIILRPLRCLGWRAAAVRSTLRL